MLPLLLLVVVVLSVCAMGLAAREGVARIAFVARRVGLLRALSIADRMESVALEAAAKLNDPSPTRVRTLGWYAVRYDYFLNHYPQWTLDHTNAYLAAFHAPLRVDSPCSL
jgi:hypothetical protein